MCERIGAVEAWEALSPERREATSPSSLAQYFLLFRYGVATLDRRAFGKIGAEGKHFLRLSIATRLEDLKEAAARIAQAASDASGFASFMAEGRHFA